MRIGSAFRRFVRGECGRLVRILKYALERERLCSGDPVCADHDPVIVDEDRTLHGAACHGYLLIAETSCEARNLFWIAH
jgi:hypothetical protein